MAGDAELMRKFKIIERRLARLERLQVAGNGEAYTITNDTTDRTYDANATSAAELADVLATLIRDLASSKTPKV